MNINRIVVNTKSRNFRLRLIGDLQMGEAGFRRDLWERCKKEILADKDCVVMGLGDYCLPLNSKILTRDGFKLWNQVKVGDDVLAYDQQKDETVWTPLRAVNVFPKKDILRLKSKSFDIKCTPDHRWYGKKQSRNFYKNSIEIASKLPSTFRIKIASENRDAKPLMDMTDRDASIIGWIVTDGYIRYRKNGLMGNVSISQKKEPYVSMLRILLSDLITGEYSSKLTDCKTFNLQSGKIRNLLNSYGFHRKEDLVGIVGKIPSSARKAMLTSMLQAEGSFDNNGSGKRFAQKAGPVLEAFKILCTLEGLRLGNIKPRKWGVYCHRIMMREFATVPELKITKENPSAVWCPSTDYGTWVTQQGEQITITGNTDSFRQTVDFKIRHALLEDSSAYGQFDEMIFAQTQNLATELKPFAHKIIGLHEGHHFHTFANGTTSTQHLCQLLKTRYFDFVSLNQLCIHRGNHRKSVDIFSTHGCGGSSKQSSDLKNLENKIMPSWDADVYIRGHSTRCYVVNGDPLHKLNHKCGPEGQLHLVKKNRLLVNNGGFMDGYVVGNKSNYVERTNLPATTLGYAVIEFSFSGKIDEPFTIRGWTVTE